MNKMAVSTYRTITLSVNELNAPFKTHRVAELIKKKKRPQNAALQETHFRYKDT